MDKVAIVTGGSSGIGRECARALAAAGCRVYEFSRRCMPLEGVAHFACDVTDEAAVAAAVQTVLEREGRIDLLINNAGYGISGAVEFTETAAAQALFDVNFFGAVRVNRAVLPAMRAAKSGVILHISSVAAPVGIPFQAYYSAAKAAINSYTLALANEVRPFGVQVRAVLPGDIATGFTDARQKSAAGDAVYGGRIARSVAGMERDERTGMSAAAAGCAIARIALKKRCRPLVTLGFGYKCLMVLIRHLPAAAVNRIVYWLYAR